MEVASVSYRLYTWEKNYHPTMYDTDLCHCDSDKIGSKTIVKRTKHYMGCPITVILLLLHRFQRNLCVFIFTL